VLNVDLTCVNSVVIDINEDRTGMKLFTSLNMRDYVSVKAKLMTRTLHFKMTTRTRKMQIQWRKGTIRMKIKGKLETIVWEQICLPMDITEAVYNNFTLCKQPELPTPTLSADITDYTLIDTEVTGSDSFTSSRSNTPPTKVDSRT